MSDALQKGRDLLADMNPGLEQLLADRYDALVPGMAETLVEYGYGRHYARAGVDLKTRQLCTIAALTALGGHTAPQLKVNIKNSLAAGASQTEIIEVIWQMALYGGMPAAINGLNAAKEVFEPGDGP
ncbi:carboxymuconolactone decarboxylase family protein [Parasedimentitalea huanghaiensis]|uniref:Carboxymuconolactone decarboxylase family protein n=1 Tax=Parasedimentitalea huanghaiensis TaxID=2682100 RepID=A0A6L6WEF6_9RHOB|nr:carboxymuconolactone decarboxylase family protein [Zongyanglinia huanghaiensis]MVO15820.1 carboxymuconolactone decarboxylase family protein [Zongyanglinia huanghaiensis]